MLRMRGTFFAGDCYFSDLQLEVKFEISWERGLQKHKICPILIKNPCSNKIFWARLYVGRIWSRPVERCLLIISLYIQLWNMSNWRCYATELATHDMSSAIRPLRKRQWDLKNLKSNFVKFRFIVLVSMRVIICRTLDRSYCLFISGVSCFCVLMRR